MKIKEAFATLLALQEKVGDEYDLSAEDLFSSEIIGEAISREQALWSLRDVPIVGELVVASKDWKYGDFDGLGYVLRPLVPPSRKNDDFDGVREGECYTRLLWGTVLNSKGEQVEKFKPNNIGR